MNTGTFRRYILTGVVAATLFNAAAIGQTSLFDALLNTPKLELVITTDLRQLTEDRDTDEAFPATFAVYEKNDLRSTWEIKIEHRGRYRRKFCGFPPLKLDFDKDELEAAGLATFDKFKLVTHCLDDKTIGNENMVKEHLVYELYNILSPHSYRSILTKVTYQDQSDKRYKIERYALLLEPTAELAHRMQAPEVEDLVNPPLEQLDPLVENRLSLFQYMIGNEDWSIQSMRNLKAFRSEKTGQLLLVPYDFDFSGIINTSYAVPNTELGLVSVEERAFMGNPVTPEIFQTNKAWMISQQAALLQRLDEQKKLSALAKSYMQRYLASFYPALDTLDVPLKTN